MRDGAAGVTIKPSVAPGAHAATSTGASVNVAGYNSAACYFIAGSWTDGSHTPKLQDSPDGNTWTDVAIGPAMTSAATMANWKAGYTGANGYLRAVVTVSGATVGATYAGVIILGLPLKTPAPA